MTDEAPLIAFLAARLDEAERTVYEEGSPPHGVIAWLTYHQPDGSMGYTTVAHGDSEDGAWIADGKELPKPASVLVVYDPAAAYSYARDCYARTGLEADKEAMLACVVSEEGGQL